MMRWQSTEKLDQKFLVEATSTEEVAAVVKLCNENKVPVTPSGARTGLVGGAVSIGGGVMISLTKMNKILGYDKENFVVKIQSGVLLNDLAQDAEKQDYYIHQIQVRNSQQSVET